MSAGSETSFRKNLRHGAPSAIGALICAAVLAIDLQIPLGVATGMLYVAAVLTAFWVRWPVYPFVVAALATLLTVIGYRLSPSGGIEWMVVLNRVMSIFVIWVAAVLVYQRKKTDRALRRANETLEARVMQRTAELRTTTSELQEEVTERVRQAESLRRREAELKTAQRIAALGSWEWDIWADRLHWSEELYRIYELSPETFVPTPESVRNLVHPDDRTTVDAALRKTVGEGIPLVLDHRIVLPGGTVKTVHQTGFAMRDKRGAAMLLHGTTQDVTDRVKLEAAFRESEARLAVILKHVPDAVITADEKGIIDSFNAAAQEIFGFSESEAVGQNVRILMSDPDRSQHDRYLEEYLRTGKGKIIGIGPREVVGLRKDGTSLPLELAIGEMWTGQKRIYVAVARDITQRKESETRLHQSRKMETVGQLTGGVAHDFNNLLTVIIGNLQILNEKIEASPAIHRLIETATKAAFRGADLTQRLLAFARRQPLNPTPTDVNALVSRMSEVLRRTLGEHIEVETVLGGGLWPAMTDTGQLENTLLNLAINARDAMPKGGRLTIETANTHLDQDYALRNVEVVPGQYVMIAISDTGLGMTQDVLERAFEPFFTTKGVGKGTGLGLSMVYGFVKQSGGHVKMYSEPRHGTTVRLYLPKAPKPVKRTGKTESQPTAAGGTETILVVEDDPDVRALVVSTLSAFGYRVFEAEQGPAALEILDTMPVLDLLLTDVVLPGGMNGRELADAVQKRLPQVKVLFSSGYTENAIIHHGRLDEGTDLLVKPSFPTRRSSDLVGQPARHPR